MESIKKRRIYVFIYLLIGALVGVAILARLDNAVTKENETYFTLNNFKLTGILKEKIDLNAGGCVLKVNYSSFLIEETIDDTNFIGFYSKEDSVIYLFSLFRFDFNIGDSILVDSSNRSIRIFKRGHNFEEIVDVDLYLPDYINKPTMKKMYKETFGYTLF
jgi:hypothetical protein